MTTIKLSEQVRRLEDTIESLRAENKKLRAEKSDYETDEKDEVIDHLQHDLQSYKDELATYQKKTKLLVEHNDKLTTELSARLRQVEDLQSSYKTLQKENERLKSKLEQTVDEYDEDYKTFHKDDFVRFDENFRKIFWDFLHDDMF